MTQNNVPPFAVSDSDLREAEEFCRLSGLDQIGRICAELRGLRSAYQTQAKRLGMMQSRMPDPNRQFASDLDRITGESNAPPVP